MRSKLNYLTSISLSRKIKTKWFLAANLILLVAIVGVINIDSIINFFGGDFNEKTPVYVVDETNMAYDMFKEQLDEASKSLNNSEESSYQVEKKEEDVEDLTDEANENKNLIVVTFDYDENGELFVQVISKGYIDSVPYQLVSSSINNVKVALAMLNSNISSEELAKIYEPANIERVILNENEKGESEGAQMIMSTVFPMIILPFFMLTIFLVQMIGAEVNDEKTTRGMEIIISNVSPKTHFFSKVLAGNLFVLIQGALLVLFVVIAFLVRGGLSGDILGSGFGAEIGATVNQIMSGGLGDKLIYIIPLTLLLMILTFIGYSLLAGILASMTTNIEDFQQLQTPIMIISFIGYFLAIMASMFQGSIFIRIASYIPFISAILSPSLLVLGHIGVMDVIISIILMIIVNYLLIKYGLKIYKVGILNYSSKGLWKKMFKALKE